MSFPQDAGDMDDERPTTAGSITRARERAAAGLPREDFASFARRMAQPGDQQAREQPQTQAQVQPQPPQVKPKSAARRLAGGGGAPSAPAPARTQRLQAPPGLQTKDGQIGLAISKPTPVAQWPLPGPLTDPPKMAENSQPYQPPPGMPWPPKRPPRPSRVPSILDSTNMQQPTPVFQQPEQPLAQPQPQSYTPQSRRESDQSSSASRQSSASSAASIPDFPVPVAAMPPGPPRRSVNLGPPPSARRGASSFYSNASFVSPIPEESPRSRSHMSIASSAAMPESWGTPSPGPSPQYPDDSAYEDIIPEEARSSAYGDEGDLNDDDDDSQLVRSASIGKKGRAALVTTAAPNRSSLTPDTMMNGNAQTQAQRPGPSPVQGLGPFQNGTGYVEASSSSEGTIPTIPTGRAAVGTALTADSILDAYDAASATDPTNPAATSTRRLSSGRPYSRLSWSRRPPPRLDMDAVRRAESRGSLTSLPELIKRATRLAASLERGRRPASRFDDLSFSPGDAAGAALEGDKELSVEREKHQSGLSDMLAAFPPPAQANRRSVGSSWPLPLGFNTRRPASSQPPGQEEAATSSGGSPVKDQPRRRRCCGLPLWGFTVLVILALMVIAAAVVVPLELLVLRKNNNAGAQSALAQCQSQLACQNGGTNVVSGQGFCSCICTNGFTGFDCSVSGANGCTMTDLGEGSSGSTINNVTLGNAIPRLIQQAQTNFSIPLSGTEILGKFNAGNLSCSAENALVTFDGETMRQGDATSSVTDVNSNFESANNAANPDNGDSGGSNSDGILVLTVTLTPGVDTTIILDPTPQPQRTDANGGGGGYSTIVTAPVGFSTVYLTTLSIGSTITPSIVSTPTPTAAPTGTGTGPAKSQTTTSPPKVTGTTPPAPPSSTFAVTEEVLDFARAAVLFILQEESLDTAEAAQIVLQRFFTTASEGVLGEGAGVTTGAARNLTLGSGNSIDLVDFVVDAGQGLVGKGVTGAKMKTMRRRDSERAAAILNLW